MSSQLAVQIEKFKLKSNIMQNQDRYLFRGKRTDGQGWAIGDYYFNGACHGIIIRPGQMRVFVEVDPITIVRHPYIYNKDGHFIFPHDVVCLNGKNYKVVDDGWRIRFERNLVEFGENEDIVVDEDNGYIAFIVGNIHDNPELLKQ